MISAASFGIAGLRLRERRDHRRIQVREVQPFALRQFGEKLAVAHQHGVVAAREMG